MIWVILYLLLGIYVIQLKSIAVQTRNLRLGSSPRSLGTWVADGLLVIYWPVVLAYWILDSIEERLDKEYGKQV